MRIKKAAHGERAGGGESVVARVKSEKHISYTELAKRMGISPRTLRNQIVTGVFPIGYAAKKKGGDISIYIPREPAERFLRTGRFPV